jgi:hypothetical protein
MHDGVCFDLQIFGLHGTVYSYQFSLSGKLRGARPSASAMYCHSGSKMTFSYLLAE